MPAPKMQAPVVNNPTEFSVDVNWEKVAGATKYRVYRRKIPEEWSSAKVTEVGNVSKITVEDLEPTSTYQFRIAAVTAEGEGPQSDETTIDTAVGNCTPKKKCTIQ